MAGQQSTAPAAGAGPAPGPRPTTTTAASTPTEPAFTSAFTSAFTYPASLAEFQQPLRAYLDAHPQFDAVVVGACVFYHDRDRGRSSRSKSRSIKDDDHDGEAEEKEEPEPEPEPEPELEARILLLQRAPTDSMPLRWEIPGGACDLEDESLLHAAARELREEAGLRARTAAALVVVRDRDGRDRGGDVFFSSRGQRCKWRLVTRSVINNILFYFNSPLFMSSWST